MKSLQRLEPLRCVAVWLSLLLACHSSSAQPVYRCGNRYSQTPCAVDAVTIQADDPRTEAQRTAAQQGALRDKALAMEMEAARHRDEAVALARIRAEQAAQSAQARQTSTQKKAEEKQDRAAKASAKRTKSALRTAQVQEPGVFTALSGSDTGSKRKKAKAKRSEP